MDRIHQIPELVAATWCEAWQRWTLQPVDPGDDRAGLDLYLLHHDEPQAGAAIVIYHWVDPDPDVAHGLHLPFGQPVTHAGRFASLVAKVPASEAAAARVAADWLWRERLQRLHDLL